MSKKKYNVTTEAKGPTEPILWDELINLYEAASTALKGSTEALRDTGVSFEDIIETNKDIKEQFIGATKSYADLTTELLAITKLHSVPEKKDGVVVYKPFVGEVDISNEKHQETYLYIVMAYGGLSDKIEAVSSNVVTTLLGGIKEITDATIRATDKVLEEKECQK